jgi:predicted anti-sigma-YlaC factor YlaD
MKPSDMNCQWVRDRIDPYLDEELSAGDNATFGQHVGACLHCREELAAAKAVLSELRKLPAKQCPDHVVERVFEHIETQERRRPAWRGALAWLGGRQLGVPRTALAGALALVVIVSSLMFTRTNEPTPEFTPEEIAQAEAALKWTFAYVNKVSRQTGYTVRDDVIGARVVVPVRQAVRATFEPKETPPQTDNNNGGSV